MIDIDRNKRPLPWRWNPSRLSSQARSILYGCEMLLPLWRPGAYPHELIKGRQTSQLGSAGHVWAGGSDGISFRCPVAGSYQVVIPAAGNNRSFLAVVNNIALPSGAGTANAWLIGLANAAGSSWCAVVGVREDGLYTYYEFAGSATTIAGGAVILGKTQAIVGVSKSGSGGYQRLWVDGVQVATRNDNDATFATSLTRLFFDTTASSHAAQPNADIFTYAYWTRTLSDTEAIALSSDPYQILRPINFRAATDMVTPPIVGARSRVQVIGL